MAETWGNAAAIPPKGLAEFETAARRPSATQFRSAIIRAYKPMTDDGRVRAWKTLENS